MMIKSSTDFTRDAMLGKGVYLTDVSPWESDYKIALNNWDDGKFRYLISIYDLQSTSQNLKKITK